jgi:hypothetical protein
MLQFQKRSAQPLSRRRANAQPDSASAYPDIVSESNCHATPNSTTATHTQADAEADPASAKPKANADSEEEISATNEAADPDANAGKDHSIIDGRFDLVAHWHGCNVR